MSGSLESTGRPGRRDAGAAALPPAAGDAPPTPLALAVADLVRGGRMTRLWGRLGWQDVRRRYRRSALGPWWITLSTALMIALLGTLYGALLKQPLAGYLPHVAAGLVVWTLLASLVGDGCQTFVEARGIVRQIGLPLSVHAYRMVWRNLLGFGHNAVLLPPVAALFGVWPGWTGLLALAGLAAVCVNGVWVGLVFGTLTARFRDVPPIVESVMRVVFLATPIVWTPALLEERAWLAHLNPFHHLIEVVRAPLLGELPAAGSWAVVGAVTVGGWAVALALYARCRGRIAYWL